MAADIGFTEGDAHVLLVQALDRDADGVASWIKQHIVRYQDMHALCEFLGRVISTTWPMALTKTVTIAPGDYWAMENQGEPDPAAITASQMITASLNRDWDTLTALIGAALTQPEDYHGHVVVRLIDATGDGLRAIAESADSVPPCGGPSACWACFAGFDHPRSGERVPFPAEQSVHDTGSGDSGA